VSRIEGEDELRARYAEPSELVRRKVRDRLDEHTRRFVSLSPFCCLGTADADGGLDVSPRGGAPGFVEALDDRRLLLPDERGNNRLDSLGNVLEHPQVGLVFFVPGVDHVLRVNGSAELVAEDGGPAGLVVTVEEVFFHCGAAVQRAKLWDAEAQRHAGEIPPLMRMIREQLADDPV
jgi:uncharacterized protein